MASLKTSQLCPKHEHDLREHIPHSHSQRPSTNCHPRGHPDSQCNNPKDRKLRPHPHSSPHMVVSLSPRNCHYCQMNQLPPLHCNRQWPLPPRIRDTRRTLCQHHHKHRTVSHQLRQRKRPLQEAHGTRLLLQHRLLPRSMVLWLQQLQVALPSRVRTPSLRGRAVLWPSMVDPSRTSTSSCPHRRQSRMGEHHQRSCHHKGLVVWATRRARRELPHSAISPHHRSDP